MIEPRVSTIFGSFDELVIDLLHRMDYGGMLSFTGHSMLDMYGLRRSYGWLKQYCTPFLHTIFGHFTVIRHLTWRREFHALQAQRLGIEDPSIQKL